MHRSERPATTTTHRPPCFAGRATRVTKQFGRPELTGGFYWFFLFGLFFGFLFFGFEFVAHEFEDGDLGAVADTVARGNDAGVAAGAIGEFGRDFAEEFLGDSGRHDVGGGLAARLQRVAFAEGDHFFRYGTRGFGAGQSGGDAAVFEQVGDQVAQGR